MKNTSPETAGLVQLIYAMLSDVCHPAVGGNLLLWSVGEGRITLSGDYDFQKRKSLMLRVLPTLTICGTVIIAAFEEMNEMVATITAPYRNK